MRKRQLTSIFLFSLFFVFLSTGCAHRPVTPSQAVSEDLQGDQNRQITTGDTEQMPSGSEMEDKSDEDFFEDEFEEDEVQVADPLSPWNRAMFHFNDKLYFWALKPLARGYKAIAPDFVRTGVKNFFRNIATPIRLVNCILQAKGNAAAVEFSRFVVNTTIGVLGFGSPADKYPRLIPPDSEDLGQTLGNYGIGNGIYIVWPIFGPSTLRDSIGRAGDFFLDPVSYVEPAEASVGIRAFDTVNNTSFRIGDYETLKKSAIDPYTALRDIYLQIRENKIKE
ncbi:MAG: phospholipid-binding lipoprotein MlaA [Desulfobacteraceae bacterium Eth-SRB2]|nr:MAG: phospholipid-binding lipoprotein MlaA [Desulfobacteraceae bacterium Eth-SRB2]